MPHWVGWGRISYSDLLPAPKVGRGAEVRKSSTSSKGKGGIAVGDVEFTLLVNAQTGHLQNANSRKRENRKCQNPEKLAAWRSREREEVRANSPAFPANREKVLLKNERKGHHIRPARRIFVPPLTPLGDENEKEDPSRKKRGTITTLLNAPSSSLGIECRAKEKSRRTT